MCSCRTTPRLRAADRRRQLLDVAADLFARRGFRGTTTAELAKSAGVTEPILYRHFTSKLDLFVTLIDEIGLELIDRWTEALESVSDPMDRLGILLGESPGKHQRAPSQYRIILQAITESGNDPAIVLAVRRQTSRLHSFVATELRNLQVRNVVRDDEPAEPLAWLIIEIALGRGMLEPGIHGAQLEGVSGDDRKQLLKRLLCSQ